MKLAQIILYIVFLISVLLFIVSNFLIIFKKETNRTKKIIIISGLVASLISIPEIILNILLSQSCTFNIVKLVVFALLLIFTFPYSLQDEKKENYVNKEKEEFNQ